MLSYSAHHIVEAVHINLASMMEKRFIAGRIELGDLVTSPDAQDKLNNSQDIPTVVYDESTRDPKTHGGLCLQEDPSGGYPDSKYN